MAAKQVNRPERTKSSIVLKLNTRLFFRLLGIYVGMNLLITLIFCGGMFIWAEKQAAEINGLVEERGVPTAEATDEDVAAIRRIAEESGCTLNDRRDQRNSGTYLAFVSCVYAFLGIITLVTVLNIVNSISMSVSARVKQYGAMRAVGMDGRQVRHMIAAEAFTYAVLGGITGCALGLPLHWVLYDFLIARRFPYAVWRLPAGPLALILCFVIAAALLAACAPSRRICRMPVAETINEL